MRKNCMSLLAVPITPNTGRPRTALFVPSAKFYDSLRYYHGVLSHLSGRVDQFMPARSVGFQVSLFPDVVSMDIETLTPVNESVLFDKRNWKDMAVTCSMIITNDGTCHFYNKNFVSPQIKINSLI
jgi:hypothetical protein